MELTVKTLRGSCVLSVRENTTASEVKQLLHAQYQDVATIRHDRLVFKQTHLEDDVSLQHAGVMNGDQLVLLEACQLQKSGAHDTCSAPDAADIRRAITEEARRRGIEHTLSDERPAATQQRRRVALPRELLGSLGGVDEQLVQFLEQALDGQFQIDLRLGGSADEQAERDEEGAEEQELQVPEPQAAHIAQLTDMGFAEALARKALILTRDNVQLAVEWLFEHGDDPNAADAPTQEQLRQVYGRRRSRRRQGAAASVPRPPPSPPPAAAQAQSTVASSSGGDGETGQAPETEAVSTGSADVVITQLTEMGFDAAAAQQAIDQVGPHLELAMGMLLGQGLSAAIARERGSDSGDGSGRPLPATCSTSAGASGEGGDSNGSAPVAGAEATTTAEALDDGAEYETAEEDNDEEYDDEEEEDYVDYDESEDEEGHLPLHALAGTMGSMDLNGLGSADMEQLLQGVAVQELYGNHLLMAGSIEGGMGGAASQGSLLRLMEAPGILQQMVTALQEPEQQERQPSSQQQQQTEDGTAGQQQQTEQHESADGTSG